jgi:hypothetical protein
MNYARGCCYAYSGTGLSMQSFCVHSYVKAHASDLRFIRPAAAAAAAAAVAMAATLTAAVTREKRH